VERFEAGWTWVRERYGRPSTVVCITVKGGILSAFPGQQNTSADEVTSVVEKSNARMA
jgi:hypothetical protein